MKKARKTVSPEELRAALRDAPFEGWRELDHVLAFSDWADAEMLKKVSGKKFQALRVRDRIAAAVRARLEILTPHKEAVSKSLAFLAPPPRNLYLPKIGWATADAIWRAAGDTSTDYNHYTKRLLLSGVLTSTTLFWLNDDSDGHEKTWAFLDRRIENVLKIGQAIGKLKNRKGG